jgi:D-alanyl-D-alanine carboxypeptidase/D-alanyl-D-alanine-endopeptidase (penicillin-binding protein 4)
MRGQAHLKTGSLEGVRAVAGYLLDKDGRRWIVVALVNHPKAGAARPALEALLHWVWAGRR